MEQAIIDFIIVVLGILFALLINRVNEKRNHSKRINSIMDIVVDNMTMDLKGIKERILLLDTHSKLYNKFIEQKNPNDDILKKCERMSVTVELFEIETRGYSLLKDARIDFEFKDSILITQITSFYKLWVKVMEQTQDEVLMGLAIKNTEHRSSFNWFHDVAINSNNSNQDFLEYLRTDDFRNRITYKNWVETILLRRYLSEYREGVEWLLEKIEASDYK
jgi:hypothetical protein